MKIRTLMFILLTSIILAACSPDTDEQTEASQSEQNSSVSEADEAVAQPKTDYALIQKLEEQERQALNSRLDLNDFISVVKDGENVTEQHFYADGTQIIAIDEVISEGETVISRTSFVYDNNRLYAYNYEIDAQINGKQSHFSIRALFNIETNEPVQFTKKINNIVTALKKEELGTIIARAKSLNYKGQDILKKRAEIAKAQPTEMKGAFISAADSQIFIPCFSDQVLWVDSSSPALSGMKISYSKVATEPYQEVFAEVTAKQINDTQDTVNPGDYSGFLAIAQSNSMSAMSPELCGEPSERDQ